MALLDLIRLADLALSGHSSPHLPEDLLRGLVEETSSRAGVLRRDGEVVARWPRTVSQQVEDATEGWAELPLSGDGHPWQLRVLQLERLDEVVLAVARLALRAWDLREELKRARFDERFHLWELEAIRSIATSIGGILDRRRLAEELIAHLVALLGVRSAELYLGDTPESAELIGRFGAPALPEAELERAWRHGVYGEELVALPLRSDSGTFGILVAAHKEARAGTEPLADNDVRLLELFRVQLTVAMEYVRLTEESLERERLRQELEVAAVIQSHLHPEIAPEFPGYRLKARSSSSRHVAGDTYDILVRGDALIATVSDVSGKGVGAGMLASGVHAAIRLLATEDGDLNLLARQVNSYLFGVTEDNRFATFAMVRVRSDGRLEAVNAGHCPIMIRRRGGSIEHLSSSGLPLGIMEASSYSESTSALEPGDLVILYTDGLTEAEDLDEEEFGVERVAEVVSSLSDPTADSACIELLKRVEDFTCGRPLKDDATLVVLERVF